MRETTTVTSLPGRAQLCIYSAALRDFFSATQRNVRKCVRVKKNCVEGTTFGPFFFSSRKNDYNGGNFYLRLRSMAPLARSPLILIGFFFLFHQSRLPAKKKENKKVVQWFFSGVLDKIYEMFKQSDPICYSG